MALQIPAQFNQLNVPAIDQAIQQKEWNALRMQGEQQRQGAVQRQMDADKATEIGMVFSGLGKQAQEWIRQDPDAYAKILPGMMAQFQRLGIPKDKIPPAGTSPQQLLQDFQEMQMAGESMLAGQPQADPKLVKDAAGYQRFAGGDNFGQRAFPDVEKPASGGFGTTGSLQELNAINADRQRQGLEPVPAEKYLSDRRQTAGDLQRYNAYVAEAQKSGTKPMSEQEYAATRAGTIAAQTAEEKGEAERIQGIITQGQEVADGLPVLRRSLELMDVVATGGVLREAQLEFAKTLGIETADQGELSANLGKAVLSQLRETFGAAFTKDEGERLIAIEAGFGKNNNTNRRLLGQTIAIVEAKANRAIKLARTNYDEATAQIIEEMMNMSLSSDKPGDFSAQWEVAPSGTILQAPDGTWRQKP